MSSRVVNMGENESDVPACTTPAVSVSNFEEDIPDTTNMCRLCMRLEESGSDQEFVDISADNPDSDTPITKLFIFGLSINVQDTLSSAMPNKVCRDCLAQLCSYSTFKQRCLDVDIKLRHIVSKKQKLAEAQALYGPVFYDINSASPYTDSFAADSLYFEIGENSAVPSTCLSQLEAKTDNHLELKDDQLGMSSCLVIEDTMPAFSEEYEETTKTSSLPSTGCDLNQLPVHALAETGLSNIALVRTLSTSNLTGNYGAQDKASSNFQRQPAADSISSADLGKNLVHEAPCAARNEIPSLHASEKLQSFGESTIRNMNCDDSLPENPDPCVSPDGSNKNSSIIKKRQRCKRSPMVAPEVYVIETEAGKKNLAFKCPLCQETFPSRILYRSHIPTHGKPSGAVCKHCDKWFQTTNAAKRHERIHSGEKPFKCILCDRCFTQREILQRHILTHSDPKPFQCDNCDKNYTQKEALANHVKNYHSNYEIVQYQCNLCDKAFCHTSGLSRHMAVHAGKQFVCEVCNRRFHDTSSLRRHVKNQHTNLIK